MQIYVVRPGDTLYRIANRYGVSIQAIVESNSLQQIPYLVPGQALVIPSTETAYRILPGDTLWAISRKFNVSVGSMAALNNISPNSTIYPGMVLIIPAQAKNFGYVEVNTYMEPTTAANDAQIVNSVGRLLTYISPFSYRINEDGSLISPNDGPVLTAARPNRIGPLMVVTNFRNGTFDSALVHTVLSSEALQRVLIGNIRATLRTKGYYGVNIDFERIPAADRQLYNSFLRRIGATLRPLNYSVSTALAPKPFDIKVGEWHGAHDYRVHGEIVDFVVIMTYEWGWSGGPPMAVAPINEVKKVIDFAVSVMPANKILMGMPLYGYDWKLPYVAGAPFATRVSPQGAIRLAAKYGASIQYDPIAQSPFFNYTDENGVQHIVWFEDARSVRAKFMLVNEMALRGVSYWVLGLPFPQNWVILEDMFNIVKVVT